MAIAIQVFIFEVTSVMTHPPNIFVPIEKLNSNYAICKYVDRKLRQRDFKEIYAAEHVNS